MASLGSLRKYMILTMVLAQVIIFLIIFGIVLLFYYVLLFTNEPFWYTIALSISILFGVMIIQWIIAPKIIRFCTKPRQIKKGEFPTLEKVVGELSGKAGVHAPSIAIMDSDLPNSFVFGRRKKTMTLVVTRGLLAKLTGDELRAVLAHEIGHIKHQDIILLTASNSFAIMMHILSEFLFYMCEDGFGEPPLTDEEDEFTTIIDTILNKYVAKIPGCAAYIIYQFVECFSLAFTRTRELYADAYAAYLVNNPRALASALSKIVYGYALAKSDVSSAARSLYVIDPQAVKKNLAGITSLDLNGDGVLDTRELQRAMDADAATLRQKTDFIFSTHPSTYKRILILMSMEKDMRVIS